MSYQDAVLADSPFLYWKLDDTTGSLAVDTSGNGKHGLIVGDVLLTQSNLVRSGNSFRFNSTTTDGSVILSSGSTLDFPTASFSIEFWFDASSMGDNDHIFSYFVTGSGKEIRIDRDRPGGANTHFYRLRVQDGGKTFQEGPDPAKSKRQHVVINWVSSSGETVLYVQGRALDSGSVAPTSPISIGGSVALAQDQNDQTVSGSFETGNSTNGFIDEFAIYPVTLSADRVMSHWISGVFPGLSASNEISMSINTFDLTGFPTAPTEPLPAIFRGLIGSNYVYRNSRQQLILSGATNIAVIRE